MPSGSPRPSPRAHAARQARREGLARADSPAPGRDHEAPASRATALDARIDPDALAAIAAAVESGAGLTELARSLARALDASLAITDARGVTVAAAARSPADERSLLSGDDVHVLELRIADSSVGALRVRAARAARETLATPLGRLLLALVATHVHGLNAPERASQAAAAALLGDLLGARAGSYDLERSIHHARELALDIEAGVSLIVARAHPQAATEEGFRERVRSLAERAARATSRHAIAALSQRPDAPGVEVLLLVPGAEDSSGSRAANAVLHELQSGLAGCSLAIGRSRVTTAHAELPRAASEALLAANVAEGAPEDQRLLAFDQTGAYRLLLPAMSESPGELRRFYAETLEPLVAYDQQYETELVRTLSTYLDADGNVAGTAQRLFTHRHTVYYRLDRVRELSGLDVSSSDGREKLSLGLKAMRVLGIGASPGPASELGSVQAAGPVPGTPSSRVPRLTRTRAGEQ